MILLPAGARVWLATGYTNMRKGLKAAEPSRILAIQPTSSLCASSVAIAIAIL